MNGNCLAEMGCAIINAKANDNKFRWTFEIDTKDGVHIGRVNSYLNDREYKWRPASEEGCLHTIGIDICESSYWHKGYGTQAFTAFIKYFSFGTKSWL